MSHIQPSKTIIFKTVGDLEIPLDIFLPDNSHNVPVLLWYHGGGLLQGRRTQLAAYMRRAVSKYNLAVISADYRLCPQASVGEVLEDVQDCIAFIRNDLRKDLPKESVDVDRLAVSGSSAGGYLALLAGLYVQPKPRVIVPIYPITDPFGTFFTNRQPPPMGRYLATKEELAPHLDPSSPQQANCGPLGEDVRMNMYVRMMHDANLAQLYHLDLHERPEEARKFQIAKNIHEHRVPPTYLLHGDSDTCVGVEQGDEVAQAIRDCGGVALEYERPPGKDHFLDTGDDYENERMFDFIKEHI